MNLIRYTPRSYPPVFSHGSLLDELDRLFETGFRSRGVNSDQFRAFPIDVYQDKDAVTVRAELPGFRKEDLQVNVADDVLTIAGQTAADPGKNGVANTETSIERHIALLENLNYEKVVAAYENGVLIVTLPKRVEAKPTTVAVEVK